MKSSHNKFMHVASVAILIALAALSSEASPPPGPVGSVGLYYTMTSDPTTGGGYAAPLWQIGYRTDVSPTQFCFKFGGANTAWVCTGSGGGGSGTISGSGTANNLTKWTSATAIGNAVPVENAGVLTMGETLLVDQIVALGTRVTTTFSGGTQSDFTTAGLSTASELDITVSADTSFTGIVAPAIGGTILVVRVTRASTNTLKMLDEVTSSAANQFEMPGAVTWNLTAGMVCLLRYSTTASKWQAISITTLDLPSLAVDGLSALHRVTATPIQNQTNTFTQSNTNNTQTTAALEAVNSGTYGSGAGSSFIIAYGIDAHNGATFAPPGSHPGTVFMSAALYGTSICTNCTAGSNYALYTLQGTNALAQDGVSDTDVGANLAVVGSAFADNGDRVIDSVGSGLNQVGNKVALNIAPNTCPGGQFVDVIDAFGNTTCAAAGGAGTITGSGTSPDLAIWSTSSNIVNYAGSGCGAGSNMTGLTGSGQATCSAAGAGTITGTVTSGSLVRGTGSTAIGAASALDDGTTMTATRLAYTSATDSSTGGTKDDYALGNTTVIYATGAAETWDGFTNGVDGRIVYFFAGTAANVITFANNAAGSSAANRIATLDGQTITITGTNAEWIEFMYNGTNSRWQVVSTTHFNSPMVLGGQATLAVGGNLTMNGTANSITGKITWSNGAHMAATGTSPGLSAGCGTGATITGPDIAGVVVENATSFGTCTLTFVSTFTTAPSCVVTPRGVETAFTYAPTATTLVVTNTSAETFDYMCIGH